MSQDVVIIGPDGREHVFPAGFDPKRAAAIVRDQPVNVGSRAAFTVNNQPVSDLGPDAPGVAGGAPFSAEEFTPSGPSGVSALLGGIKETLSPVQSWDEAKALFDKATWDPGGLVADMAGGMINEGRSRVSAGATAIGEGNYGEGVSQILAGVIPGVGPMIRDTGEAFGRGETMRGFGRAAGLAAPFAALKSARWLRRAAPEKIAALRQSATRDVTQALDPTKEKFKATTAQIAPEVVRRRLGGNLEQVMKRASAKAEDAGEQIGQFWDDPTRVETPLETGKMVGEIELQKSPFQNIIKDPVTGQPTNIVVLEPRVVSNLTALQKVLEAHGDTISSGNARRLLTVWADQVAEKGGYAHRSPASGFLADLPSLVEVWSKREGASAIRTILGEAHPDIKAINKEFTFWKRLTDVAEATQARKKPHKSAGLTAQLAGNAGAGAGALVGGMLGPGSAAAGALIGGTLGTKLSGVFNGPRWKFFTARQKANLADALASNNPERITRAVGTVLGIDQAFASQKK